MEYFSQIPLCEITKYLDNDDYCNFRLVNNYFYQRTINEYDKRKYTFMYMIKRIYISNITQFLDNKDKNNFYDLCKYLYKFKPPPLPLPLIISSMNYNVLRILSGQCGLFYST